MNKIFISTLSLYCLSIYSLSGKEFNVDEYFPGLPVMPKGIKGNKRPSAVTLTQFTPLAA